VALVLQDDDLTDSQKIDQLFEWGWRLEDILEIYQEMKSEQVKVL
jgi:hypothetical protein